MALRFVRSSSQYASLASSFQSLTGSTITGWVTSSSFLGDQFVMHWTTAAGPSFTRLGLRATSGRVFQALARRLDGDSAVTITEAIPRVAGVLYFVACVARYNAQSLELYVNGVQTASAAPAAWTGATSATSGAAAIGSSVSAANFQNGTMQDVRFYNTALSSSEIVAIYNGVGSDGVQPESRQHQFLMDLTTGTAGAVTDTGTAAIDGVGVNSPAYIGQIIPPPTVFVFGCNA